MVVTAETAETVHRDKPAEQDKPEVKVAMAVQEEAAAQYKNGEISVEQFAAVFDQYTPVMPLAYRRGVLYVAADVSPFAAAGPWSLYGDITKLTMKETELTK